MKQFIICLLFFSQQVYAQDAKNAKAKNEILELKIENLQKQLDDAKEHNKELQDVYRDEVLKVMAQKEDALDTRMVIYVSFFVVAFAGTLGFFRWLGKREIRNIINELATTAIDSQLKEKLSNEVVDAKLTSLGKPIIDEMLKEVDQSKLLASRSALELEQSNEKYKELLGELIASKGDSRPGNESTPQEKEKVKEFNEVLDQVKEEDQFSGDDWFFKGQEADNNKEFDKAIQYFTNSIEFYKKQKNPALTRGFLYRGFAYFGKRDFEKAHEDFTESLKLDHKYKSALDIRSYTLRKLERYEEALADMEKLLQIDPANATALQEKEELLQMIADKKP
jgi:tetratricopeptide (TPR) repeat protein